MRAGILKLPALVPLRPILQHRLPHFNTFILERQYVLSDITVSQRLFSALTRRYNLEPYPRELALLTVSSRSSVSVSMLSIPSATVLAQNVSLSTLGRTYGS